MHVTDPDIEDSAHPQQQPGDASSDTFLNLIASTWPDFNLSAYDFPTNPEETSEFPQPGFVRAVENDFLGRNWHESWWDTGI